MSELIITEKQDLVNIADAVREKTGTNEEMTLSEIAYNVRNLSTGDGNGIDNESLYNINERLNQISDEVVELQQIDTETFNKLDGVIKTLEESEVSGTITYQFSPIEDSDANVDVELSADELVELNATIATLQSLKKSNTAIIAFLADLHMAGWTVGKIKKAVAGYNKISSSVKTDLLLFGGDYLDNSSATTKDQALTWYSDLRNVVSYCNNQAPVAVIKGNHDDNTMHTDYANGLVDFEAFYDAFGNVDEDRTIRNAGNVEDCYGYYDIPNQKIRVFYVNTVDIPQKLIEVANIINYKGQWDTGISIKQLQFVADNLKFDTPGWHVMVCSHHPLMYDIGLGNGSGVKADRGGAALLELLDKFNTSGGSGSISVTAKDFEGTVNYDFTSNQDCKVIACINGHTHRDGIDIYNDSFFCISTRAVYGHPSHEGHISSSAYFVVDRNNYKLRLIYNGDGEENVFNYNSLITGEEESTEPVYEEIASPFEWQIGILNNNTGELEGDSQNMRISSIATVGFTTPAVIDMSGYASMYDYYLYDTDGNFIEYSGAWTSSSTPFILPVDKMIRFKVRGNNYELWDDTKIDTFASAIKVYVEEGGEAYYANGYEPSPEPDVEIVEISSPFTFAFNNISDYETGTVVPDTDSMMRILSNEIIGFTSPATIDLSAYDATYAALWYDADGNYIENNDWTSTSTPIEVPVDKTVRILVRHNNWGAWTEESKNTFTSAIKIYIEEGGEAYLVNGSIIPDPEPEPEVEMVEIDNPFRFTIHTVSDSTGELVLEDSKMRIASQKIKFTKPATIDMSAYMALDDAVYQLYWYDTDGNYHGEYATEWKSMDTLIEVPVDKAVRIKIRYSNYYSWEEAHRIPEVEGAIKVYVEEGGEAIIIEEPAEMVEIASPFDWQIGQNNTTTGDVTADTQSMRIVNTDVIAFTTDATIDMSAYNADYTYGTFNENDEFEQTVGSWTSTKTTIELPANTGIRIKLKHKNYELWSEEKISQFASAIKVYVEEGGEAYFKYARMVEITSPFTFGINNLNSDGDPIYDAKMLWVVSNEIIGFTKPAKIDLSGYSDNYRVVQFDADGNFVSNSSSWIANTTILEVPANTPVRIVARNSNWGTWTEESKDTFTAAIKVYIEEGGETYVQERSPISVVGEPLTNVTFRIGSGHGGSPVDAYENAARIIATQPRGEKLYTSWEYLWGKMAYPITVPETASKVTVTCPGFSYMIEFTNVEDNTFVTGHTAGWHSSGESYTFEAGAYGQAHITMGAGSSNVPTDTDTSGFSILFE